MTREQIDAYEAKMEAIENEINEQDAKDYEKFEAEVNMARIKHEREQRQWWAKNGHRVIDWE